MATRRRRTAPKDLDGISVAIGSLQGGVDALIKSFDQHCADDDRRHRENIEALGRFHGQLAELTGTAKNLTDAIAAIKPDVAEYREHRAEKRGVRRLAYALWLGVAGLAGAAASLFASHPGHPAPH